MTAEQLVEISAICSALKKVYMAINISYLSDDFAPDEELMMVDAGDSVGNAITMLKKLLPQEQS